MRTCIYRRVGTKLGAYIYLCVSVDGYSLSCKRIFFSLAMEIYRKIFPFNCKQNRFNEYVIIFIVNSPEISSSLLHCSFSVANNLIFRIMQQFSFFNCILNSDVSNLR